MSEDKSLAVKVTGHAGKIDVNALMAEFSQELGPLRWEEYRVTLSHFLMGKLSRPELVLQLREKLTMSPRDLHNHNTLVLSLLANACRGAPAHVDFGGAGFSSVRRSGVRDLTESRESRLFQEVLSLPARDRRRIKAIGQDPDTPPLIPPPPPSLQASRQEMLPHIPYLPDQKSRLASKGINARIVGGRPGVLNGNAPTARDAAMPSMQPQASSVAVAKPDTNNPHPLMDPLLDLHPGKGSGPLTWTQDILQGLETPLISETHEFPENNVLATQMLGVALENGLLQGIGAGTTDMMFLGLESYLRNIVDQLVELKHRKINSHEPLMAEDLYLLVSSRPAEVGEHMAPMLRLRSHFLEDGPTVEGSKKRESPWDLYAAKKRTKLEQLDEDKSKLLEEHKQGLALVADLLG